MKPLDETHKAPTPPEPERFVTSSPAIGELRRLGAELLTGQALPEPASHLELTPSLVQEPVAEPKLGGISNEQLKLLAEQSLYVFAKGILGYDRLDPEIHGPLCKLLEDYEKNRRLVVVLPRSWFKTTLCSIAYPIWRAVRAKGNITILLVQNSYDNAVAKLKSIKEHWEQNEILRSLWPELVPRPSDIWKSDSLCLHRTQSKPESTFECGGIRQQFISRHYDLIIEDDTVAPKLNELGEENVAPVKEDIEQAIGFHGGTTDLQADFRTSQIMVVGTRWFEKDLISWIELEQNKRLKAEKSPDVYVIYRRACLENEQGEADENGHITFPARFDMNVLRSLRAEKGSYMFKCLYLNMPTRGEDMLFREEWFTDYEKHPTNLWTYTTVDPAGDPEENEGKTDYNVVMTCGVQISTGKKFVLRYDREQCNPTRLIDLIFEHVVEFHPECVGIEGVAYQKSIKHHVKNRMREKEMFFEVRLLKNASKGRSKLLRIRGLQPGFENRSILTRAYHTVLKSEALSYPYGKNDDVIDALAMQLELWALVRIEKQETVRDEPQPHELRFHLQKIEKNRNKILRHRRVMGSTSNGPHHRSQARFVRGRIIHN